MSLRSDLTRFLASSPCTLLLVDVGGSGVSGSPGEDVAVLRLISATDTRWFRRTFGVSPELTSPFQVLIARDGSILATHTGVLAQPQMEEFILQGRKQLWERMLLSFAICKAVEQKLSLAPNRSHSNLHSADSWIKRKKLKERGICTVNPNKAFVTSNKRENNTAPPTEQTTLVGIKLLNGERLVERFNTADTRIQDLVDFINQNRTDGDKAYRLVRPFPRHVFTSNQYSQRLRDIDMEDNVLLMLESVDDGSGRPSGSAEDAVVGNPLWAPLFALFAAFLHWISNLFSGAGSLNHGTPADNSTSERRSALRGERGNIRTLENDTSEDDRNPNEYFGGDSTAFLG